MPEKIETVSFVIPTYRRPDMLRQCLNCLGVMHSVPDVTIEVRIYDNGGPDYSNHVLGNVKHELPITYYLNEPGHGLGYSLSRGAKEARGQVVVELNDDAMVAPDFLKRVIATFESDSKIGVMGVRAIEDQYESTCDSIGTINRDTLEVQGNFDRVTAGLVDVEHVYGFCYAYRKEILHRGAVHDSVLLAKDYSSGNRIETDHCLSARRLGYRVVYDGSIAVGHLARPRPDLDERSLQWKQNHWRNTMYLFLKHYGLLGENLLAIRFACSDVGIRSLIRQPNKTNLFYFLTGLNARASACWHWLKHLTRRRKWEPLPQ